MQKGGKDKPFQVVLYRSRALKDAETRYSATEKEALAVRWSVKKISNLLLGGPQFKVMTTNPYSICLGRKEEKSRHELNDA